MPFTTADVAAAQGSYLTTATDPRVSPGLNYLAGTVVVWGTILLQKQSASPTDWTQVGGGGGGGGGTVTTQSPFTRYVDASLGNDTTGNGSFGLPFQSISKAVASITDQSANYAIVLASGTYTEAGPIAWSANISMIGDSTNSTAVNVPLTFTPPADTSCNFQFRNLVMEQVFTIDASASGVNGVMAFYVGGYLVNRTDSNLALITVWDSCSITGTLGGSTLGETIVLAGSVTIPDGCQCLVSAGAVIGGGFEIVGSASLETFALVNATASSFVNGTATAQTPTWTSDVASAQIAATGAVTTTILGGSTPPWGAPSTVVTVTGDTTVDPTKTLTRVNATAPGVTITMPSAGVTQALAVANVGTAVFAVTGPGSLTDTIPPGSARTYIFDGTVYTAV